VAFDEDLKVMICGFIAHISNQKYSNSSH